MYMHRTTIMMHLPISKYMCWDHEREWVYTFNQAEQAECFCYPLNIYSQDTNGTEVMYILDVDLLYMYMYIHMIMDVALIATFIALTCSAGYKW